MSTQKQTKRSRMKRAAHAFGRTVQHYSPKVLSVFESAERLPFFVAYLSVLHD